MSGHFVSFEGVEGSGKSTLGRSLADLVEATGVEVLRVREPGGSSLGERIRAAVLEPDENQVEPWAELFLMLAARAQLVREQIRPALARGAWVFCDRYADSSEAYQGHGRLLGPERVRQLNQIAVDGLWPERTFLVDLDPAVGRARQTHEPDRMEQEAMDFHGRVREGYLALAAAEPERYVVLDGTSSPSALVEQGWSILTTIAPSLPAAPPAPG